MSFQERRQHVVGKAESHFPLALKGFLVTIYVNDVKARTAQRQEGFNKCYRLRGIEKLLAHAWLQAQPGVVMGASSQRSLRAEDDEEGGMATAKQIIKGDNDVWACRI